MLTDYLPAYRANFRANFIISKSKQMETFKATATLFLDKRRSKKENKYPVKLRIYFDSEDLSYRTGIDLTTDQWEKIDTVKNLRDDNLRVAKRKIYSCLEKAQKIIERMDSFSFKSFKEQYFDQRKIRKYSSLKDLFDEYVQKLESNEQIGTAISYATTINSITKFAANPRISDVTLDFLYNYEKWMKEKKLSPSTIGIYMRQLRCIINIAINKRLMSAENYPFKKYEIPTSRNIKKALKAEEIKAILQYETDNQEKRKAVDFWVFSYLSNGMNVADICHLKPQDLEAEFFHFFRAKTKNTKKKDLRPIKVPLTSRSRQIISKWRNTNAANPYLFPILHQGLTARQIKFKIQDFIYFINKQMKEVAKELKIDSKVGTYVARHSHSTILKRKGIPTEFIKENLGHSSVLTTENYLGDFTDDVKLDYAKLLTEL